MKRVMKAGIALAASVVIVGVVCLRAWSAVPLMINHQGLVKVNAAPFTGNGLFKFGFVDNAGKWLWTNDGSHVGQSAGAGNPDAVVIVPVNNGIYRVNLGDTTITNMVAIPSTVFDSSTVTLRVIFNDGTTGEQILAPDQPITTAAYAYHAANADDAATVGGKSPTDLNLIGEVKMWAGPIANVPAGWLPCDGRALSRTAYAGLFGALGTIHGPGDGSTTFNVPDFRDRTPMGARQDVGGVPKTNVSGALTQTGGEAQHILTVTEMPAHSHQEQGSGYPNAVPLNMVSGSGPSYPTLMASTATSFYSTPLLTLNTGGDQPHNVLNPYFAITFIIKY